MKTAEQNTTRWEHESAIRSTCLQFSQDAGEYLGLYWSRLSALVDAETAAGEVLDRIRETGSRDAFQRNQIRQMEQAIPEPGRERRWMVCGLVGAVVVAVSLVWAVCRYYFG